MNLMRQDPMKAAAQRHHAKYLPPPPHMYQQMAAPTRTISYGMHPYRPYPSQTTRVLPPTSISMMPHLSSAPSSLVLSALVNDHHYNHYKPQASDLQIKAVRIPSSKLRRPSSVDSFNIADSVVRQLLDLQPQQQQQQQPQQQQDQNYPSVLVIEDPDVASASPSEVFGDSLQSHQKILVAPPVHAELASDSSSDNSGSSSGNPEVFVIVSKNKNKNTYYTDDKKSDILSAASSTPKLKKYKITSAYDENGGRQVWIIKK